MTSAEDILFCVHPTLALAAYFFIFVNLVQTVFGRNQQCLWRTSAIGWFLLLGGLVSGMVWAQAAWGSYWNWDPKETATLALFLSLSAYIVVLEREYGWRYLRLLAISNASLIFITLMISKLLESLHSHYY